MEIRERMSEDIKHVKNVEDDPRKIIDLVNKYTLICIDGDITLSYERLRKFEYFQNLDILDPNNTKNIHLAEYTNKVLAVLLFAQNGYFEGKCDDINFTIDLYDKWKGNMDELVEYFGYNNGVEDLKFFPNIESNYISEFFRELNIHFCLYGISKEKLLKLPEHIFRKFIQIDANFLSKIDNRDGEY